MKKLYKFLICAAVWFVFTGCEMSILNERLTRPAPFNDVVEAVEMRSIQAVNLKWKEDKGADDYILMRSVFEENGFEEFLPIYRGSELAYIDRDLEIAVTYAYRLDKTRGSTILEGNTYAYYSRPRPSNGAINAQSVNGGKAVYLLNSRL